MVARAPIGRGRDLPLPAPAPAPRRPSAREQQRTGSTPAARSATRGEIVRAVTDAVRGIEIGLRVPGKHPSGPSYEELLGYLVDGGRDFLAVTPAARKHLLASLTIAFESARRVPTVREMRDVIRDAFKEWVLKRFAGKVRDQHLRALTIPYARRKKADGYGGEPIGVRTGALRDRIEDAGRVVITAA